MSMGTLPGKCRCCGRGSAEDLLAFSPSDKGTPPHGADRTGAPLSESISLLLLFVLGSAQQAGADAAWMRYQTKDTIRLLTMTPEQLDLERTKRKGETK